MAKSRIPLAIADTALPVSSILLELNSLSAKENTRADPVINKLIGTSIGRARVEANPPIIACPAASFISSIDELRASIPFLDASRSFSLEAMDANNSTALVVKACIAGKDAFAIYAENNVFTPTLSIPSERDCMLDDIFLEEFTISSDTPPISSRDSETPLMLLASIEAPCSILSVSPANAPAISPNAVSAPLMLLPSETVLHNLSIESHNDPTVSDVSLS